MNAQMIDSALAEVADWLFAEEIETLPIRSGEGEPRQALVINAWDAAEVRSIIEEGGAPCSVSEIPGTALAKIEGVYFE